MKNTGNILAVVELDDIPEYTISRAVIAAKLRNCGVDLLICEHPDASIPFGVSVSAEVDAIRDQLRDLLDELSMKYARQIEDAGIEVTTSLLRDRPIADGIIAHALETDPCIVMKGTQFHSRAARGLLIDTDWELMRQRPYPLWLVKSDQFSQSPTVIASIDPVGPNGNTNTLDRHIVNAAKAIALPLGGEIRLLHTYQSIESIGRAANRTFKPVRIPIEEIDRQTREKHAAALSAFAADQDVDPKNVHLFPGRASDVLPAFVRDCNADLVVMGALARWSKSRNIIGSTAERVLDHLPCDVLILQDNDYALSL